MEVKVKRKKVFPIGICDYCGDDAFYRISNGVYCCKPNYQGCPIVKEKRMAPQRGVARSDEACGNISAAQQKRWAGNSEETRRQTAESVSKIWEDYEYKIQHTLTKTGHYPMSPMRTVCECGCNELVNPNNKGHDPRKVRFLPGHGARGENHPMYGKTHTKESMEKRRQTFAKKTQVELNEIQMCKIHTERGHWPMLPIRNECECGCRQLVNPVFQQETRRKHLKNEDGGNRFLPGHNGRGKPGTPPTVEQTMLQVKNRSGHWPMSIMRNECECGCGELTGPGKRYVYGHWSNSNRDQMRETMLEVWADPEYWAMQVEAHCKGSPCDRDYCDAWYDKEFKESILERDSYTCQNPDCWEYDPGLSIHHIDYDKKNCHPLNLITLCRSCNGRANGDRQYWQELYTNINNPKPRKRVRVDFGNNRSSNLEQMLSS